MEDNETRFGECRICKQKKLLQSVIGSYKGELWAGWICSDCYRMFMEGDKNGH